MIVNIFNNEDRQDYHKRRSRRCKHWAIHWTVKHKHSRQAEIHAFLGSFRRDRVPSMVRSITTFIYNNILWVGMTTLDLHMSGDCKGLQQNQPEDSAKWFAVVMDVGSSQC